MEKQKTPQKPRHIPYGITQCICGVSGCGDDDM